GKDRHLYRAVDSSGPTLAVLRTAKRDPAAATGFFRKARRGASDLAPRVSKVDQEGRFPPLRAAFRAVTAAGGWLRPGRGRLGRFFAPVLVPDHRALKQRGQRARGAGSFRPARGAPGKALNPCPCWARDEVGGDILEPESGTQVLAQ
ncbi:MAG: DDE-type integrase/transposase/recombinase, partial [Acidobacteriaceae bacterium]|nr:DDE-type integrase/transposase/recombinase [Acidobacteriaceae bacterium]